MKDYTTNPSGTLTSAGPAALIGPAAPAGTPAAVCYAVPAALVPGLLAYFPDHPAA